LSPVTGALEINQAVSFQFRQFFSFFNKTLDSITCQHFLSNPAAHFL